MALVNFFRKSSGFELYPSFSTANITRSSGPPSSGAALIAILSTML